MTKSWKLAMLTLCLSLVLVLGLGLALAPASTLGVSGPTAPSQVAAGPGSLGSVMDGGACYLAPPDWICCPQPDGTVLCRRPL